MAKPRKQQAKEWWQTRQAAAAARLLRGRFTGLTIALVCVSLAAALMQEGEGRDVIVDIGFTILVLFAVSAVGRALRLLCAGLAVLALGCQWALHLGHSEALVTGMFLSSTIFLAVLTWVVLFAVFRDEAVSADTIVGAVCAYLLIGVTFGSAYALLVLHSSEAIWISPRLVETVHWRTPTSPLTPLMQYYSFVSLSTLGFGDMSPLTAPARALTIVEGVTGQLYLAVLVARLVGMHTARLSQR